MSDPNEPRMPPAFFKAKYETGTARRRLNDAQTNLDLLQAKRERYDAETVTLEADPNPGPIVTAKQALARGNGSGLRIRFQEPVTDAQLDEARKTVAKAKRQHAEARDRMNEVRSRGATYLPAEAAERVGSKWVAAKDRLPLGSDLFHRGDPIPDPVLRSLGYEKFQALLRTRFIEQVIP